MMTDDHDLLRRLAAQTARIVAPPDLRADVAQELLVWLLRSHRQPERYSRTLLLAQARRFRDALASPVRIPQRIRQQRINIVQAAGDLERRLGRRASRSELAAAVGVTVDEVDKLRTVPTWPEPIAPDGPVDGDDEVGQVLVAEPDRHIDVLLLRRLDKREREVLSMRDAGATWQDIGEVLGVSRQRAYQVGAAALEHAARISPDAGSAAATPTTRSGGTSGAFRTNGECSPATAAGGGDAYR